MKKKISYLVLTFLFIVQFNYSQLQGGATHIASSTTDIPVNTWTYIAITKGANNDGKLYKNGSLIYSGPWHNLSYVWSRLDLGAVYYTSFSSWFNGQIDEVRVSNLVRTPSEISNHFSNNVPFSSDSNTLGLWHFDGSNPNIITSTIGQNGAGYNTASTVGKFGNSISYNGINSRVQINQSFPTSNLTLEFWIKPSVNQLSWPISFYGMNTSGFSTSLNNCIPPAPTGNSFQTLCSGATIANLNATGTAIKWYSSITGGTALAPSTVLVNGATYFATQTVTGCESTTRLEVDVSLNNPTVSASSSTICAGQSTTLTALSGASTTSNFLVGSIGPSGGYVFYDQGSVINGWRYLEGMPYDVVNTNNFGLGCYCNTISNTSNSIGSGSTNTIAWATAGCPTIASTFTFSGFSNWFIPSKDELNLLYTNLKINNLGNFQNLQYWSSSPASYGSCGINGGAWVQNFTNGTQNSEYRPGFQGSGNLRLIRQFATGTSFSTYLWSTGATTASINVTPASTTQYWVDVTSNGVTCRKNITITVNPNNIVTAPSLTPTLCINTALPASITHSTTGATGIGTTTSLPAGMTATWAANTITISGTPTVAGTFNYSIPLTGGCGTVNATGTITVNPNKTVTIPSATPTLCINTPLIAITHTTTGATGIGTPTSLPAGVMATWISNTITLSGTPTVSGTFNYSIPLTGGCGSVNAMGSITILPNAPSPTGSASQTLCSGATVTNLNAIGTTIKWYAASSGGTVLASTTALVNGTTYYASQTVNGCESITRFAVTVSLNNPTVSATATTICGGSSVSLTASDANNSQQIDNKIAQFSNNVSNMIGVSYNSQSIPTNNFSYEFWFNTNRTINLLSEKTGGVSVQAINGQNFAVHPDFYNNPNLRGSGISVGTNGVSVVEHSANFFDARLTHTISLVGWHHCAVVYQNNTFSLYIDGNFIGSRINGTNFGGFGTNYNNVGLLQTVGKGYPGFDLNDNYTGKLDEFRQWSVALTSSQITQIYNRKLQSISMTQCNLNLTFDQNTINNNSITPSGLSLSNTSLPTFSSDNTFQIGGFTGTNINSITNTNFTGTSSSSYSWSTGQTSQTITVIPAETTEYWVDVTTNGVTCRKYITINVNINIAPSINVTTQSSCTTPSGSVQITSPISGGITPQNIFISEVIDANSGALAYIELFNKTGNTINLSNYKIKIYNNGISTPSCATLLSGTIANNATYVIKLSADNNQNGIIPNFTLANCSIDTNDNIRLTTLNDIEIDIWGRTDGIVFTPNNQPGFTYRRKSNAILPSTTWSPVDWNVIDPEDYTNIGTYVFPTNNIYNYSVDGGAFQTSTIFNGLAIGNHTITVKDMITGCTSSSTFTIQSASIVPTGDIEQTFCNGATVSNLVANGTTIKWYLSSTGGTALTSSTLLLNNTSYFATQTINGCESQSRLGIKVTLVNIEINTPQTTICPGGSTTLTAIDLNNLSNTNCLNVSAQLENGLQAFYPFCGDANDISGNSLNGTVAGAILTSDRFGNLNSAYSFGQNQQITIPNTSGRNIYPLTISLWYNPSALNTGQNGNLFSKYTVASWNGFGLGLFDHTFAGQGIAAAPFYLRNTSNRVIGLYNESPFNQSNVHLNTWYQLVFTLDVNGGKIYLNGQLIDSHNWTGTAGPSNSNDLWKIGGKWDYWFNGKIDDVAIWNRVLSPLEVQEIYSTPMTTTSSTYLWSTGATTPSITVNPTQTTQYSVAVTTNGVTCTKNITITVSPATPAPTGASTQIMSQGTTLANLVVTGQNIVWYSSPTGGTPLPANTPLVNGVTYYASQTINGCESQTRLLIIVQIILSSNEFDKIKIVYYPNPVNNMLYIKAPIEVTNVKIYNLLGQKMLQQKFNSNEIQINMSDFSSGTYFVTVESDDKTKTIKILKD